MKYYFTFSNHGQLFKGGWVEIVADSLQEAQQKFIDSYGEKAWEHNCLNYAFHYPEEAFNKTIMATEGNLGNKCHEVIK